MAQEPLKLVWADRQLEFDLINQRYKIGRGAHNEIQIPDQLVSSNHAEVRSCVLTDKGSTNGTFVNGDLLGKNEKRLLKAGDVIMFGDTKINVERGRPYEKSDGAPASTAGKLAHGDDSDSSEEENDIAGPLPTKKDESPIAWHPGVSPPTAKVNGAPGGANHDANAMHRQEIARKNAKNATTTRLLLEKKQREKEKKLEERIQELEHQMYYGEEMKVKHEQSMSSQYAVARTENETLKKEKHDLDSKLSALVEKCEYAERRNKSYESQLSHLMEQLNTLRMQLDRKVADSKIEGRDEKHDSSETIKQVLTSEVHKLRDAHTGFERRMEDSVRSMKIILFLFFSFVCACVLALLFSTDLAQGSLNFAR